MCLARARRPELNEDNITPRIIKFVEEYSPSIKMAKYMHFSKPTKVHSYRSTAPSPESIAAIVLHPSHKWHSIHENWKKEWAESSKKLMETLWKLPR